MPRKVKQSKNRVGLARSASATLLSFARPLLDAHGDAPRGRVQMQETLMIATAIWNAVAVDRWESGSRLTDQVTALIDEMPASAQAAAREMLRTRKDNVARHPWAFGEVNVEDDGKGGFDVHAEMRADRT